MYRYYRMIATRLMHQLAVTVYIPKFWRAMPATIMPSSGGRPPTTSTAWPAASPATYSMNMDATLPPGTAISPGDTFTRSRHQATAADNKTATASAAVAGHRLSDQDNSDDHHVGRSLLSVMRTLYCFRGCRRNCRCASGPVPLFSSPISYGRGSPKAGETKDNTVESSGKLQPQKLEHLNNSKTSIVLTYFLPLEVFFNILFEV